MDMRQLSYFVAVAEEGHLGRAAERLHLSQPPLSRQIQALEAELGTSLFIRTSRGMTLTQPGAILLQDAQKLRNMAAATAERARRAGRGQAGRLDIGVYGSSIFGLVPRVLAAFKDAHPDVELVMHHIQTQAQTQALRHGRVAALFERFVPAEPDIVAEHVARESVLLALSERHPLAQRTVIEVEALREAVFIVGTAPASGARVLDLCRHHGFEPRFAAPSSDVLISVLSVALSMHVALVPASMSNVDLPGLVYRPLKTSVKLFIDLHCYYMPESETPLLSELRQTIRSFKKIASKPQPTSR